MIQASEESIDYLWLTFTSGGCDTQQVVLQRDRKEVVPSYCAACKQRSADFSRDSEGFFNCAVQTQVMLVQEPKSATGPVRDTAGTIEILVRNDLVNKIAPGTDVMCVGVLRTQVEGGGADRRYSLYLDVVDLQWNDDTDEKNFDYSAGDFAIVERMRREGNPLKLLVHSLCPKIVGQEMVKAAVLLGLFSCTPREYAGRRREAHVLLVGDPGLGKSEVLEACATVSPRGIFVSSNSCTSRGLTATMGHDSAHKSSVEAGALVMADQGVSDRTTRPRRQSPTECSPLPGVLRRRAGQDRGEHRRAPGRDGGPDRECVQGRGDQQAAGQDSHPGGSESGGRPLQ